MPTRRTKTVLKNLRSLLPTWKSPTTLISRKLESARSLSAEDRIKRAQAAQELLGNSVLREAVQAEEDRILAQMLQCSLSDSAAHTRLVMALQMASAVQRNLWARIQDGHEAAAEINVRGTRID